jgi:Peptidase family M23
MTSSPLFPQLQNAIWKKVDLNEHAQREADRAKQLYPHDIPHVCDAFVKRVHKKINTTYSYGGYMEDRTFLWRDTYMAHTNTFIHLGVDIQVPAMTQVHVPHECTVVQVVDDTPEHHGWGTRVTVLFEKTIGRKRLYGIFAHLVPSMLRVGMQLHAGNMLGQVGTSKQNGGWFEHLHVQTIDLSDSKMPVEDILSTIDGYAHIDAQRQYRRLCPDPLLFLSVY